MLVKSVLQTMYIKSCDNSEKSIIARIIISLLLINVAVVTSENVYNSTHGNGIPLKRWNREKNRARTIEYTHTTSNEEVTHENFPKPNRSLNSDGNELDVIIIGAGWAGIAAAISLESQGYNCQVLEARDRIGGRSRTVTQRWEGSNIPMDLGSNWVHETKRNPMFDLVQQNNIPHSTAEENQKLYQANNNGAFDDNYIWSKYDQLYDKGFYPYQKIRQEDTSKDFSLRYAVNGYDTQSNLDAFDESALEMFLRTSIEADFAASVENLSLWWWNTGKGYSGRDAFLYQGYTALFEAHAAPVQSKIETQAVVRKINYKKSKKVKVTYVNADGAKQIIRAKKVLVTVPLGVLKAKSIKFRPNLPKKHKNAIRQIGMGTLNKIYMIWKKTDVFWPPNTQWFSELPKRESNFEFYNPISFNGGLPFIVGFVAGDEAVYLEEQFGDNQNEYESQMQQRAMLTLRNMYGNDIPNPEKIMVTKWATDTFSRGSYSYNKVGMSKKARNRLKTPVKSRIYLAGEATSAYYGTTHGAYLSGKEAANKIMS